MAIFIFYIQINELDSRLELELELLELQGYAMHCNSKFSYLTTAYNYCSLTMQLVIMFLRDIHSFNKCNVFDRNGNLYGHEQEHEHALSY